MEAPTESVAVSVTWKPDVTSELSGVPLNTPVPEPISTKLAHVGIVVPARLIEFPSTSVVVTM